MTIDVFIKGIDVDLICLNQNVLNNSNWYNWFNDEETTKHMQKHYYPNTYDLQLQYFKSSIENNKSKMQCGIFHKQEKVLIGTISLNNIDLINRNCELSVIIGEKKFQNLNFFIESHKLMLRHAFDTLNLNKVYGGTIIKEMNILFCRVLGYTSEGKLIEHVFKNGKYHDAYRFGILNSKFQELKNTWFKI
jgi:ribosomal-protein-alanine N-acetyltransferase